MKGGGPIRRVPATIRAGKKFFQESWLGSRRDGFALEESLRRGLIGSLNQIEAVQANVEKRARRGSGTRAEAQASSSRCRNLVVSTTALHDGSAAPEARLAGPTAGPTSSAGRSRTFLMQRGWAPLLWLCAVGFGAGAGFGLALPLLTPEDPRAHGLLPLACGALFGSASVLSVVLARWMPRYAFTVGPAGFHEAPRHQAGTWIAWSRVAQLRPRPYAQRLELRGSLGERLGSLEYQVDDLAAAFQAILSRVTPPRTELPAEFRWRASWPTILVWGGAVTTINGVAVLAWLQSCDRGALVLLPAMSIFMVLISAATMLRRTRITADGVTLWRGARRRTIAWHDVARVALAPRAGNNGAKLMDIALELRSGRVVYLLPAEGDLLGVLHAAQLAHAASASGGDALAASAAKDQPSNSFTARRGNAYPVSGSRTE